MNWEVEKAHSGEYTAKLNGVYLYSKYKPKEGVIKNFKNIEFKSNCFFLIGLGLGYHLEYLVLQKNISKIFVLILDNKELEFTKIYGARDILKHPKVVLLNNQEIKNIQFDDCQIYVSFAYMKALGEKHPLYAFIEDLKVRQLSFLSQKEKMIFNFEHNQSFNAPSIKSFKNKYSEYQVAILVSAGPSLDRTINILKEISDDIFILSVGSALKKLYSAKITPNAVIITDSNDIVAEQFKKRESIPLFFLSTASNKAIQKFNGDKYIIYQEGFSNAQNIARLNTEPLLETGGSVATTAISLLEYIGFKKIILFGQDLGFENKNTHSSISTSNNIFVNDIQFRKVLSNSGKMINTTSSYNLFRRWIEKKIKDTNLQIYNTAYNGAKIKGSPFINDEQVLKITEGLD